MAFRLLSMCLGASVAVAFLAPPRAMPAWKPALVRHATLNDDDKAREQRWLSLEASLRKATKFSDFDAAAEARDQLLQMEMDAVASVLAANQAFYRCFSERDAIGMAEIWEPNGWATCTHPGQQPLYGFEVVMDAWRGMLGTATAAEKVSAVEASGVRVQVFGAHAVVTCLEAVRAAGQAKRKGMAGVNMHATNVFVLSNGKWLLAHHHASPVPPIKAKKPAELQNAITSSMQTTTPRNLPRTITNTPQNNSSTNSGDKGSDGNKKGSAMSFTWNPKGGENDEDDDDDDDDSVQVTLQVADDQEEDMSPQGGVTVAFDENLLKALDGPRSRGDLDGAIVTMGQGSSQARVNLSDLLESLERASEERDDDDEGEEVNDLEEGLRAVLDAFRDGQEDDDDEDDDEDAITIDVTSDEDGDEEDEDATQAWLREYEPAEMRVWREALQKARHWETAVSEANDDVTKVKAEEAMVEAAEQERDARTAMLQSLEEALANTEATADDSVEVRAEKKTARRAIEALVAQVQAEDEKDAHEERKSQHKAWRAEGEDNDEDDVEWETSAQFPSDDVSNNDSDEPMTVRLSEEVLGKLALSLDESGDLDSAVFTVEASADGASPQQSLPFSELMARFSRLKASAPTSPTSDNTREVMKRQRPRASLRFLNAQGESVGFGWARDTATQRLVEVSASGQAAAAGVQVGWRVVAVDGKAVHDNDSFEAAVTSARAKGNNSVDFEFEVPRVVSDVETVARQKAASDAARDTGFVAAAMLEEASQPGNMERSSGSRDQWETPSYGVESSSKSVPLSKSKQSEAAPPSLSSRTLEALRILTASGQLTGAEKAKLMTSMVQAKAANAGYEDNGSRVPSLVEVGFEVLVDGTSDGGGTYTEGMADFASYCRSIIDA